AGAFDVAFRTAGLRPAFLNFLFAGALQNRTKLRQPAKRHKKPTPPPLWNLRFQIDSDPLPVLQARICWILGNVSDDAVELLLAADEMIIIFALPKFSRASQKAVSLPRGGGLPRSNHRGERVISEDSK